MTQNTGTAGSEATFVLTSTSFSLSGPYTLWWCKTADFDPHNSFQVASGEAGSGMVQEIKVDFIVPESPYGANYIRLIREYRPDDLSDAILFNVKPSLAISPAVLLESIRSCMSKAE